VPYPLPSPLLGWDEGGTLPPLVPGGVGGGGDGEVAYHLPSHSWVGMKEEPSFPRPMVGWGKVSYPLLSLMGLDEGGAPPPQGPGGAREEWPTPYPAPWWV